MHGIKRNQRQKTDCDIPDCDLSSKGIFKEKY